MFDKYFFFKIYCLKNRFKVYLDFFNKNFEIKLKI